MKKPKEYNLIRDYVIFKYPNNHWYVTVERVAEYLGLSHTPVEQAFAMMNIEGYLSRACRPYPIFRGDWVPNIYYLTDKALKISEQG